MKKLISIILVLASVSSYAQQEPHYTQNQFNSYLMINPAYAGAFDKGSVAFRVRNQWTNFKGAPLTLGLNGEAKVFKDYLGVGLSVNYDKIGILSSTSADLSIGSHIRLSEQSRLGLGVKFGVNVLQTDFSKLQNVDVTDPLYLTNETATPMYLGFGLMYYNKKKNLYAGISSPRLLSFEKSGPQSKTGKPHFYARVGYRYAFQNGIELRPGIVGKYQVHAPFQMDFALNAWYKERLGIGFSYRTGDAVSATVQVQFMNILIGYSYDMTVSKLRAFNTGSHEAYIGYTFGVKSEKTPDSVPSNRYF
jgi:type IX secretion system PorP/SprF family membrane protein